MCGRFALSTPPEVVAAVFGLHGAPQMRARYNIAPSQPILAVRRREVAARECIELRWGLIPSWTKDPAIGSRMINARSETAAEKPAYRAAMRKRRCLIPADAFYEWKKTDGRKQPYLIRCRDGSPFGLAGLWERWVDKDSDETVESCAILTTTPNSLLRPIHDRMPVVIGPDDFDRWLDPSIDDAAELQDLLRPTPARPWEAVPIGTRINSPANEDPSVQEAADEGAPEPAAPAKGSKKKAGGKRDGGNQRRLF